MDHALLRGSRGEGPPRHSLRQSGLRLLHAFRHLAIARFRCPRIRIDGGASTQRSLEGVLASSLAFARKIAGTGYPFNEDAHRALLLEEVRRCYDPGGMARQIAAMAVAGDRRSRLATITAPTLVIHGADDSLIPPAGGHDTALSIPNATYMQIDGMGHDLPPGLSQTVIEAICRVAKESSRLSKS